MGINTSDVNFSEFLGTILMSLSNKYLGGYVIYTD